MSNEREKLDQETREFLALKAWEFRQQIAKMENTYERYILEQIAGNIEHDGQLEEQIEDEPFIIDDDDDGDDDDENNSDD